MKISAFSGKEKFSLILLFLSDFILCLTLWLKHEYAQIHIDELLFQLKAPAKGVQMSLLGSGVLWLIIMPVVMTVLLFFLYRHLKQKRNIRQALLPLVLFYFVIITTVFTHQLNAVSFLKNAISESDFIQDNYVKAEQELLHFPEKKRNLVYIFLESMENTYADVAAGEGITTSYIPELEKLAFENQYFSHDSDLGGALSFPGTTWTAAAMVAQTSGVIVKVDLEADAYGKENTFLPGVVSIGDILAAEGYRQELLLGSSAQFHGREVYFREHGNYEILDVDALKAAGRLPVDYDEWWGFEDKKLFAFAKEELLKLAEGDQPFNLTLLTADTHFPDGYHCDLCRDDYDLPYANALACSSRQVAEFVNWIQEQDFYEDTTIIVCGDHLTMDADFMENINPDYVRTVYNCFINAPVSAQRPRYRNFGTFDLFPTTLAALGVEIEGDRLALGTNLFSKLPTLCEVYGYERFSEELQKESVFYVTEILKHDQ